MRTNYNATYRIHSNEHIISALAKKRLLRTYAHYIRFKYLYSDSRLHRGNKAKLARISGVSESTVRIQLGRMKKLGWIREENGDYIFITKNQLYVKLGLTRALMTFKCCLILDVSDSTSDIVNKLASKLIEANLKRQKFLKGVKKRYLSNRLNEHCDDKGNTFTSVINEPVPTSEAFRPTLSCKRMGELFGLSKSMAWQIKNSLVSMGIISVEPNYIMAFAAKHDRDILRSFQKSNPRKGFFMWNGDVKYRTADTIQICPVL